MFTMLSCLFSTSLEDIGRQRSATFTHSEALSDMSFKYYRKMMAI